MLGEIRRVKSVEKRPLKAKIDVAEVSWDAATVRLLREVEMDVRTAGGVERFAYADGAERLSMTLAFAPEPGPGGEARA